MDARQSTDQVEVEMAHSALIHDWPTLRAWLDEDRPSLLLRETLRQAAQEWNQHGRDDSYLAHEGTRLDKLRELIRRPHHAPNGLEQDYIRASVTRELGEQRERAELAERAQQESERRLASQRKFLRVVAGLLLLVGGLAVLSFIGFRQAEERRLREYEVAQDNASRGLAQQALVALGDEIDLSLLLAAEAYQTRHTPEARNSLLAGMVTAPHLAMFFENPFGVAHAIEFSPQQGGNRVLATGHDDGVVVVWDLSTELPIRQLTLPEPSSVLSLAFSPDGESLATGHADGRITLWNSETGELRPFIGQHQAPVTSVAWAPDQNLLASGSADGRAVLWDPATSNELHVLDDHDNAVTSVAFSPADPMVATGSADGRVILWNTKHPHAFAPHHFTLRGGGEPVWSLDFSPNGQTLAAGRGDGSTILWDVASQNPRMRLEGHAGAVSHVVFSSDTILATGSADNSIIVWNTESGQHVFSLQGHGGAITGAAVSGDGKAVVSGGWDGTLILWNAIDQPLMYPIRTTFAAGARVESLAFSPDNTLLAAGQADGRIIVWDTAAQAKRPPLQTRSNQPVTALAFNSAGTLLASGQADGVIMVWDPVSGLGQPLERRRGSNAVTDLAYSPRSDTLAIGYEGGIVRLWQDGQTRELEGAGCGEDVARNAESFACTISDLAYSLDGTRLAAAHNDETVVVWDLERGEEPTRWDGDAIADTFVAFSAEGDTLATGHGNGAVQLRTIPEGDPVGVPTSHRAAVSGITFSPDASNGLLLTSSADGELMFRNSDNGEQIIDALPANVGEVTTLAISPDGQTLASGGRYGVALWDLDPERWMDLARERAKRSLSVAEKERYLPQLPSPPEPLPVFFLTSED